MGDRLGIRGAVGLLIFIPFLFSRAWGKVISTKRFFAPGEARTHGLQIMRLTRCLLRYGGVTFSQADRCYSLGGENGSGAGQNH